MTTHDEDVESVRQACEGDPAWDGSAVAALDRILARLEDERKRATEYQEVAADFESKMHRAAEQMQIAEAMCEWLADSLWETSNIVQTAPKWLDTARAAVERGE